MTKYLSRNRQDKVNSGLKSRPKRKSFFRKTLKMQKVKRPQHIARKEHARYLNELERSVIVKEKEVEKMRKTIATQEEQLATLPDFAITFLEKQMKLSKQHADLDEINKKLTEELKRIKDIPIENHAAAAQETYMQRIATLDERITKAREFKELLEAHQKDINEKKLLLDDKVSDVEAAKSSHADKLNKINASKHVLAELKKKLEAERSTIKSKLYAQKRESEKITHILERNNAYMASVQKHLKENPLPVMTKELKCLLDDFKLCTPTFMAAREEFLAVRKKYLEASKSPLTVYSPLPKVTIGEGEMWEKIDAEARELEAQLAAEAKERAISEAIKRDVSDVDTKECDSNACTATMDTQIGDTVAEELQVEGVQEAATVLDSQ